MEISQGGIPAATSRRQEAVGRMIARHMLQSHLETAPVTVMAETDAAPLAALRRRLLEQEAELGVRVTITHLMLAVLARALVRHPEMNATLEGEQLLHLAEVNLGFAVARPDGSLLVPVIHGAESLGLAELARRAADLQGRGIAGRLQPAEMRRGTFTLSSVAIRGILWTTPIINQPQAAILATAAIREVPVVRDGQIVPGAVMPLSLTFDHRLVNGMAAARFMETIIGLATDPGWLELS